MKLETGYNSTFDIRREELTAPVKTAFTVLYLSDLHFTKYSGLMVQKLLQTIHDLNPTILLFGGDYADSAKGLAHLKALMEGLSHRKNIYCIAGNHDYFFGIERIKEVMNAGHAIWIEQLSATLSLEQQSIHIAGNLLDGVNTNADYNILCLHRPVDLIFGTKPFDLVLAGHLHGCQFVFWETAKGLFPGRFFYRWNRLKVMLGNTVYLISKGLGDTLPIRFNCPKDLIFVTIKSAE